MPKELLLNIIEDISKFVKISNSSNNTNGNLNIMGSLNPNDESISQIKYKYTDWIIIDQKLMRENACMREKYYLINSIFF